MLFNSYIFIFVFFPITLVIFFGLVNFRLTKIAKIWLTLSSLFFYGYWNPAYLPLIAISIGFNYQMGLLITNAKLKSTQAKILLWLGIGINLVIISYYKYANFFVSSVTGIFPGNLNIPDIILPLAISFYTFTQIAYLVDCYRGETQKAHYNFLDYILFVTFFPQLIAGPILRHDELIPQFTKLRNFVFSHKNIAFGLTIFSLGLAKKVLIADNISPWVALVFDHADNITFIEAWIGALSYTFQLYFDFSGYSDMAIGLALILNIKLPINFNSPYKANSITDFWRRWHITLSNFLRDYLYIPLGGNRKGEMRRSTNLIVTMLLGGLWHGAGWTFIFWGGLHGIYLTINHGWRKLNISLPQFLSWIITFTSVIVGWVVFRAKNLAESIQILQTMAGINGIVLPGTSQGKLSFLTNFGVQLTMWQELHYLPKINDEKFWSFCILFILIISVKFLPNTQQIVQKMQLNWLSATVVGLLAGFSLLSLNRVSEFLYFQF